MMKKFNLLFLILNYNLKTLILILRLLFQNKFLFKLILILNEYY